MRAMNRLALATAVGLLVVLLAGQRPADAAPGSPSATITNVQPSSSAVSFVLNVAGLSGGATVDPTTVRVSANGTPLTAQASLLTQSTTNSAPLPTRDAILVLDVSGSMAGSRIAAAKAAALAYARAVPPDVKIGLVTFSDQPALVLAPTVNRGALATALARVSAGGNTALYDAVLTAIAALPPKSADSERRLLILSDGEDNVSIATLASAEHAEQSAGVGVDMVGIEVSPQQQAIMRQLTAASSGTVLPAADLGHLTSAFVLAAQTFTRSVAVTAQLPSSLAGQRVTLTATFGTVGHSLSAATDIAVPATSAATSTAPAGTAGAVAGTAKAKVPVLLLSLCFLGLLAIGLLALGSTRARPASAARLDQLADYGWGATPAVGLPGSTPDNPMAAAALSVADRMLRTDRTRAHVASQLERAGLRIRPQEWLLLRLSAVVVTAAVCTVVSGSALVGIPVGLVVGIVGTALFVRIKAERRARAFADQLPDILQMVASSLRTGFSLAQAIDGMSQEASQPAAGEFGRALAESRLGADLEDALDDVASRMNSRDLSWVVMAVRISRDVGGNLAEVLLTTVGTIRERASLKRQVRALSAEGRLSAYVLIALPIGIGSFFALARPAYLRPLYTEPAGVVMLIIAVLGVGFGGWWMTRVVKVEV